jgi:ribonuclease R
VAIADVSHYVHHDDPLDAEARLRGNSVYFPRRVIPMLPEALSNGLCSLNPDVERLCVACDMRVSAAGSVTRYEFYPALMRSRARLTYTQVAAWLADPAAAGAAALMPHLKALESVYRVLAAARARRGAIDFDTVETELDFDDRGKILAVRPAPRNEAHKLIEECMLAANVSAADHLLRHRHPTLFRVHEGPTPEKLAVLREFLDGFGLTLGGGEEPSAQDYARLIERIRERDDAPLLQTVLLRSLRQAAYSPANAGHFGLSYPAYVHFTSPIRRYPDLLVHRAIKALHGGGTYAAGDLVALGGHCSETERRADEASREVVNWLKCFFLRERVGETFRGTVSAVTHFGVFVTLDEVFVDGLIHVSELGPDYFHFDAVRHWLRGERTGRTFRLADRLEVRLARVDLDESRLDFVLPESTGPRRSREAAPGRRR